MRIYGLDFTSRPRPAKPITCAVCTLRDDVLALEDLEALSSLEAFERFLAREGPWTAGMDFPFGQPRKLAIDLGWPERWDQYIREVGAMEMGEFENLLRNYRERRLPGDKQHLRAVDRLAASRSPMMLYGVPVGKMFFQGAPRLERSTASILPCRPSRDTRVVVEAYPALVARRVVGRRSYKSDTRSKQTGERESGRRCIVDGLASPLLSEAYGLALALEESWVPTLIAEPSADCLDALLCALQAAWAYTNRDAGYGIPPEADPLEGWIADPALCVDSG